MAHLQMFAHYIMSLQYPKNHEYWNTLKIAVIIKFEQCRFTIHHCIQDAKANSADPEQTAPLG